MALPQLTHSRSFPGRANLPGRALIVETHHPENSPLKFPLETDKEQHVMRFSLKTILAVVIVILSLAGVAAAQAGRSRRVTGDQQKKTERTDSAPNTEPKAEQKSSEEPEATPADAN